MEHKQIDFKKVKRLQDKKREKMCEECFEDCDLTSEQVEIISIEKCEDLRK